MDAPTQRPEGALLERLRTEKVPTLSGRAAAKEAGISGSRWTQIVRGYKQETSEVRVPVRAPADTLARMAKVVGATADQLREVGREDAADEMLRYTTAAGGTDDAQAVESDRQEGAGGSPHDDASSEFAAMERVAAAISGLDRNSRRRVLQWALDRYGETAS